MKRRPRQIDVARLAGVSAATVSIVLNDRQNSNVRVSPETRRRVLDAVEQLGYVADPVARSLAGGHNRLLGVFTFEAMFPIQNQDFYYRFLIGIEEEAEARHYDLLLFTSSRGPDGRRSVYQQGVNRLRLAEGSILLGTEQDKGELVQLVQEEYPFVFVGRRDVPNAAISYVAADYTTATVQVVRYLIEHGHRHIAYLGDPARTESHQDRFCGYTQALEQAGIPVVLDRVWFEPEEVVTTDFLDRLLARDITALVLEHDHFSRAVLQTAAAMGIQIPADLSLVALGDPVSEHDRAQEVTAFRIPRRRMGMQAVRLLVDRLENSDTTPVQVTLPCEFIPGNTVAPPRRVANDR